MLKPTSLAEHVMYSTVLIEVQGPDFSGVGTGFIYCHREGANQHFCVVTNSHVIEGATSCRIRFHTGERAGREVVPNGKSIFVQVSQMDKAWDIHPAEDLCVLPIGNLMINFDRTSTPLYFQSFVDEYVWNNERLQSLSAVEQVLMVGYPRGIVDKVNYFPVFRRGITATHPAIDFEGEPVGIVDAACLWGSSGSPILILSEGATTTKTGSMFLGPPQVIFLGVLFAGPVIEDDGTVEVVAIEDVPPALIPIQLGYYVKARVLRDFVAQLIESDGA